MTEIALLKLLESGFKKDRVDFETLSLAVFSYQFNRGEFYRSWCKSLGKTPRSVKAARDIPSVPLDAFKYARIACFPFTETTRMLFSSGTTKGYRSRHEFNGPTFEFYARASVRHFRSLFPRDPSPYSFIGFSEFHGGGFMSHKLGTLFALLAGECGSRFIHPSFQALLDMGLGDIAPKMLARAAKARTPVCLALSYNGFVHLALYCKKNRIRIKLPKGSFMFTGGGPKGLAMPKPKLAKLAEELFGIAAHDIIDVFSSTELSGRAPGRGLGAEGYVPPPWWDVRTVDPESLAPLPRGSEGLLELTDLLNFNNASFITLPDTVRVAEGRFFHKGRGASAGYEKLLKRAVAVAKKL